MTDAEFQSAHAENMDMARRNGASKDALDGLERHKHYFRRIAELLAAREDYDEELNALAFEIGRRTADEDLKARN